MAGPVGSPWLAPRGPPQGMPPGGHGLAPQAGADPERDNEDQRRWDSKQGYHGISQHIPTQIAKFRMVQKQEGDQLLCRCLGANAAKVSYHFFGGV